jgi:hypothetical protein
MKNGHAYRRVGAQLSTGFDQSLEHRLVEGGSFDRAAQPDFGDSVLHLYLDPVGHDINNISILYLDNLKYNYMNI